MKRSVPIMHSKTIHLLKSGIWENNPLFISVLGLCSSLAVTTKAQNALVMGACVIGVTVISAPVISLFKYFISDHLRMVLYMLVISTMVIVLDLVLKIHLPEISQELGPYVGLIITNCIIMGRIEAFAVKNSPIQSIIDALGVGLGYTLTIVFVALLREFFGAGSLFGIDILTKESYTFGLFSVSPGAFFVLGGLVLFFNWIRGNSRN